MTSLQALAERLEKATGPDRELARDIGEAFGSAAGHFTGEFDGCTESLDAAIALCERLYPQCAISILRYPDGTWGAAISNTDAPLIEPWSKPRPALALVLAVVRAKLAEEAP